MSIIIILFNSLLALVISVHQVKLNENECFFGNLFLYMFYIYIVLL